MDTLPEREHTRPNRQERRHHARQEQKQNEGLTRRRFLYVLGGSILAGAATLSGINIFKQKEGLGFSLTIEGLDGAIEKQARVAAEDWHHQFGCNRPIQIIPFEEEVEHLQSGAKITTVEVADPGKIYLSPKTKNVRGIVLHAMNHACIPDSPIILKEPLPFRDGVIRGFHGLNVLVTLKTGEETMFVLFEEGMAERNASAFKGYFVTSPSYFAIGVLTRERLPLNSYHDAHKWGQKNDVPTFIRAIINAPESTQVGTAEIEQAMLLYQRVWDEAERKL